MKLCTYVSLLLLFACGRWLPAQPVQPEGAAREQVTIQLKWLHQFQFAGYYAAEEKGFFSEEGLDVKILEFSPGTDQIDAVVAGRAEYGVADTGLLIERARGKPVVLMAQIFQHSPLVYVTLASSGIRTPFDLRGKKIMTQAEGGADVPLNAMLMKTLGSLDEVQLVAHTCRNEDLVEGQVDAMLAYVTNEPFWFKGRGIEINTIDPRDFGVDFYGDSLFTSEAEVREHPQRVARMLRATKRGWRYALDHKEEIVELILKKYNSQMKSREHLAFESEQTEKMVVPQFIEIGHFEPSRFQKIVETYVGLGLSENTRVDEGLFFRSPGVDLTTEERAWLAAHPAIRVSNEPDYAPFNFVHNGEATGYSIDYVRLLAERVGLELRFIQAPWNELLEMGKRKELDLVSTAFKSPDRTEHFLFSEPYKTVTNVVYIRDGVEGVQSLADLGGKRVALVKGDMVTGAVMEAVPEATFVLCDTCVEMLRAVAGGRADATVLNSAVAGRLVREHTHVNIRPVAEADIAFGDRDPRCRLAVRKDWPMLLGVLEKAAAGLSGAELAALEERWFPLSLPEKTVKRLALTADEQAWIAANPVVRLGIDPAWPPFEWSDEEGRHAGLSSDYTKLTEEMTGLEIVAVPDLSWAQVVAGLKDGSVDMSAAITASPQRREFLAFTRPYVAFPGVVMVRRGKEKDGDLSGYEGLKVGTGKGYVFAEFLTSQFPELDLVLYDTPAEGLTALAIGDLEAYVGNLAVLSHVVQANSLANLEVAGQLKGIEKTELRMAARKELPVLVSILDKALAAIPKETQLAINAKWAGVAAPEADDVSLNEVEEAWLKEHPVIRARASAFAPIHFHRNGEAKGIGVELLGLIAERYGFRVEYASKLTYKESVDRMKAGELDVEVGLARGPEREQFMNFTRSHTKVPRMIYVREETNGILGLADLNGKSIAIPEKVAVQTYLARNNPEIRQVFGETIADCLRMLSDGDVDAYVGDLMVTQYYLAYSNDIDDIKAIAPADMPDLELHFAVRKDWPVMVSILEKGLASVSAEERDAIQYRYYSVETDEAPVNYALLAWGMALLAALAALVLGWNWTLRRRVSRATEQLRRHGERLEDLVSERTAALQLSTYRLEALFTHMPNGFAEHEVIYDEDGNAIDYRFLDINPAFAALTGLDREITGKTAREALPEIEDAWITRYAQVAETGEQAVFEEYSGILGKHFRVYAFSQRKGHFAVLFDDITGAKQAEAAIVRERERFRVLFDQSPEAYVIVADGRVVDGNRAAAELFGFATTGEMAGLHPHELSPEFQPDGSRSDELAAKLTAAARNRNALRFDWEHCTRDGATFPTEVHLMPTRLDGRDVLLTVIHDLTERKRAQAEILRSQQQVQEVFDSAPIVMLLVEPSGQVRKINRTGAEMVGGEADDLVGLLGGEVFGCMTAVTANGTCGTRDNCQDCAVRNAVGETFQTRTSIYKRSGQLTVQRDGRPDTMHLLLSTALIDQGDDQLVLLSIDDVTESRIADAALRRSNRYQKALTNTSTCLLAHGDPRQNINDALDALLRAAYVSRTYIFENFTDSDGELCQRYAYEACRGDVAPQVDNPDLARIPYRDGLESWVEIMGGGEVIHGVTTSFPPDVHAILESQGILSVVLVPFEVNGRWAGYIGFDETRTERHWHEDEISVLSTAAAMLGNYFSSIRAEEALRESRERLQTILHSVHAGVVLIDPADGCRIVQVNAAAAQMVGLPPEEMVGVPCHRFICPAEAGHCPVLDNGLTVENSERVLLCHDGSEVPIMKTVTLVHIDGLALLLESFVDISERHQAAEELRLRASELEQFNQAMVDREMRIIEIKQEVNELCARVGQEPTYPPVWDDPPESGTFQEAFDASQSKEEGA